METNATESPQQRRRQLWAELCELALESIRVGSVEELEEIQRRMRAAHNRLFAESPVNSRIEQESE